MNKTVLEHLARFLSDAVLNRVTVFIHVRVIRCISNLLTEAQSGKLATRQHESLTLLKTLSGLNGDAHFLYTKKSAP